MIKWNSALLNDWKSNNCWNGFNEYLEIWEIETIKDCAKRDNLRKSIICLQQELKFCDTLFTGKAHYIVFCFVNLSSSNDLFVGLAVKLRDRENSVDKFWVNFTQWITFYGKSMQWYVACIHLSILSINSKFQTFKLHAKEFDRRVQILTSDRALCIQWYCSSTQGFDYVLENDYKWDWYSAYIWNILICPIRVEQNTCSRWICPCII